jgi:tetratricopeptide (TPR) repeat protein
MNRVLQLSGRRLLRESGLALVLAAIVLIYLPGLGGGFVIDDRTYFTDNDILPSLKPWQLGRILLEPSNYWGEHLPVRDFLFVLEHWLFGRNTVGYHCVSLALYLLCGVLLYRLSAAFYLQLRGDRAGERAGPAALMVTALFLFHPAHVECVAYIGGQKDLLFMVFSLAVLLLFQLAVTRNRLSDWRWITGTTLIYYLAILSRPMSLATGLLVAILLGYVFRKDLRRAALALLIWGALNAPALLALRYSINTARAFQGNPSQFLEITFLQRIGRAFRILGEHAVLAVRPWPRNFGYPFDPLGGIDLSFWIGVIVISIFLALLIARRGSPSTLAMLVFLTFLIPTLQLLVPLNNAAIYDRYISLALLGPIILLEDLCTLASSADRRLSRLPSFVLVLATLAFCVATLRHVPTFQSDVAQSEHAYGLYPEWPSAPFAYAYALIEDGRLDEALELTRREESFERPPWVRRFFLGWIQLEQGRVDSAISTLSQSAFQVMRGGFQAYPNIPLGEALIRRGDDRMAVRILKYGLDAPIYNPLAYYRARKMLESIGVDPGSRANRRMPNPD